MRRAAAQRTGLSVRKRTDYGVDPSSPGYMMATFVRVVHKGSCPILALIQLDRQREMPLLYFHIKEGDEVLLDEEGSDHPDLQAAREEAIEAIRQIIGNAVMSGSPLRLDREMQVADDAGQTLLKFTFREVVDFSEGH